MINDYKPQPYIRPDGNDLICTATWIDGKRIVSLYDHRGYLVDFTVVQDEEDESEEFFIPSYVGSDAIPLSGIDVATRGREVG